MKYTPVYTLFLIF